MRPPARCNCWRKLGEDQHGRGRSGVQNGYAERIMRTIKEEEVELSEYENYWDAYRQIGQSLEEVYMKKRIHSSLGYLTPVEFENQWLVQQGVPEVVR